MRSIDTENQHNAYLLNIFAFYEFFQDTASWQNWKHGVGLDSEHGLFVSSLTLGLALSNPLLASGDNAATYSALERGVFRTSFRNRIIEYDGEIAISASSLFRNVVAKRKGNEVPHQTKSNLRPWPFVEAETAMIWNLTLVTTSSADDWHDGGLLPNIKQIVEHRKSSDNFGNDGSSFNWSTIEIQ